MRKGLKIIFPIAAVVIIVFSILFSSCVFDLSLVEDGNDGSTLVPDDSDHNNSGNEDGSSGQHPINKNLLMNGNFIINQRAQSSYTGSDMYTVDRWRIGSGTDITVSIIDGGGVTISNNSNSSGTFGQFIEFYEIQEGETLTLSACIDGTIYSVTGNVPLSIPDISSDIYYFKNDLMRFGYCGAKGCWSVELIIPKATDVEVDYVKLEEGEYSSAPYGLTESYAVELLKCQRYFRCYTETTPIAMVRYDPNRNSQESYLVVTVFLENEMRVNPRLDSYNSVKWLQSRGNFYWFTSSHMQIIGVSNNRFQLLIFAGQILPSEINGITVYIDTVYIILDAEI